MFNSCSIIIVNGFRLREVDFPEYLFLLILIFHTHPSRQTSLNPNQNPYDLVQTRVMHTVIIESKVPPLLDMEVKGISHSQPSAEHTAHSGVSAQLSMIVLVTSSK